MIRLPPRSTRTDTLCPDTTLVRSRMLLSGERLLLEMKRDRVASTVGRRDLRHLQIRGAHLRDAPGHAHDRTDRQCLGMLSPAKADIVGAAINAIDDQIVAVAPLVGEAALDDQNGRHAWRGRGGQSVLNLVGA